MRIAATADIHFTPQSYDRIREPLSRVRDHADVLVIAGDLTNYGKADEMHSLLNALVRLRIPIVAVLGNHDYESGQEQELMKLMTAEGIKVLDGSTTAGVPVHNVSITLLMTQNPPSPFRVFEV